MRISKQRKEALTKIDRDQRYALSSACQMVKDTSYVKFDESVDLAVRLGVNPKHADQMVRGAIVLPHGTGKTRKIAVFAKGAKATEAEEAGADVVGADELAKKVSEGFLDFDTVIATPDMMGVVGRLGRVLGPRGLMPNPKVGTVTTDVLKAVKEAKAGKIEFRVEKSGIIHVPVGKRSFEAAHLAANVKALVGALLKAKPASAKGTYLKGVTISSTMGLGIKIETSSIEAEA